MSIELVILSNHLILCHSFSSCPQFFPTSGYFPMSQFFQSGGLNIEVSASASVLSMNIQDWFPLGLTGLISLLPKGLSRVFSSTTVPKYQFFNAQPLSGPDLTFAHDPTIPLLDIYPQVTVIQKDTYTLMFIAALFTRARTWKQPNMSINGWMDKEVVIHLVGFSSEISCLSGLHSSSTEKSWKGLTGSCSFKQWPTSCLFLLSWVHPLCGLPWCVVSSSPGLVQWHLEMWP